jgi:hypothetical protein
MNATTDHDDMPDEINFTGATRGKFYHPDLKLNLPVYLDAEVQSYLSVIATKKGMPLSQLASDLLKREIGIIEAVK